MSQQKIPHKPLHLFIKILPTVTRLHHCLSLFHRSNLAEIMPYRTSISRYSHFANHTPFLIYYSCNKILLVIINSYILHICAPPFFKTIGVSLQLSPCGGALFFYNFFMLSFPRKWESRKREETLDSCLRRNDSLVPCFGFDT